MKFLKYILCLILMLNCLSCFNCKKPFNTYKESINFLENQLKTKGIYVSANDHGSFYLYENGKVRRSVRPKSSDFWENPIGTLQDVRCGLLNNSTELWGDFLVKNDSTILIQTFGDCSECFCRRMVLEETGKILNDTTIIIYSMYDYDYKDTIIKNPNIFNFYSTDIKPDCTNAWFVNKMWYRRNLHETRK